MRYRRSYAISRTEISNTRDKQANYVGHSAMKIFTLSRATPTIYTEPILRPVCLWRDFRRVNYSRVPAVRSSRRGMEAVEHPRERIAKEGKEMNEEETKGAVSAGRAERKRRSTTWRGRRSAERREGQQKEAEKRPGEAFFFGPRWSSHRVITRGGKGRQGKGGRGPYMSNLYSARSSVSKFEST